MSTDLHLSASSHALDEETARAEIYGLLSSLYYQPPSAELLTQLQVAVTEAPDAGAFLEEPWRELVASARSLTTAQIEAEYNTRARTNNHSRCINPPIFCDVKKTFTLLFRDVS